MQRDPERVVEVKAWLIKAANDLRAAQIDLDADPPLIEDSLFHCQQTVEKSFKAFLVWHDRPFRKTHSIEEIGEDCITIDASLSSLVDETVYMTEYAAAFRYPGESIPSTKSEAKESREKAEKVFLEILSRLPQDIHP